MLLKKKKEKKWVSISSANWSGNFLITGGSVSYQQLKVLVTK